MEILESLIWWKYLKVLYYFGYIWYKLSTDIILDISIEYLGIEHVFIDIWYECAITIYWFCFVYMFLAVSVVSREESSAILVNYLLKNITYCFIQDFWLFPRLISPLGIWLSYL